MASQAIDPFPMCGWTIAFIAGARVDHEMLCTTVFGRASTIQSKTAVGKAQAYLGSYRARVADRTVDCGDGALDPRGITQEGSATIMSVDGLGGAAEIEIDTGGPEITGLTRILGESVRIGAEELQVYGDAARCLGLLCSEFGTVFEKDTWRQTMIYHTYEFGHGPVEAGTFSE